jgi:hypothetical protein
VRRVELRLFDVESRREQVVERLRAYDSAGALMLEAEWEPEEEALSLPALRYLVRLREGEPVPTALEFAGLVPRLLEAPEAAGDVGATVRAVAQRLSSLRTSIHWLGSMRELPPRRADYLGRPRLMHPSGREAAAVLAYDKRGEGHLLRRVSAWYEQATRHTVDVVEEAGRYSVVLSPMQGAPVRINLVDTGEGMAQVLPVLVLGVQALQGELGRESVLAIEHPELHLHPAAQRDLASFFCELAHKAGAPRVVVETHSENLLLRVQLAIARGEVPPERVLVYWVRELDDGSGPVRRPWGLISMMPRRRS